MSNAKRNWILALILGCWCGLSARADIYSELAQAFPQDTGDVQQIVSACRGQTACAPSDCVREALLSAKGQGMSGPIDSFLAQHKSEFHQTCTANTPVTVVERTGESDSAYCERTGYANLLVCAPVKRDRAFFTTAAYANRQSRIPCKEQGISDGNACIAYLQQLMGAEYDEVIGN